MSAVTILRESGWRQGHNPDGSEYWEHFVLLPLQRHSFEAAIGQSLAWHREKLGQVGLERNEALAAVRSGTAAMVEANATLLKLDAERARLESELDAKHAQLVEVADKLAHERQVVAAVREGAEQLRSEIAAVKAQLSTDLADATAQLEKFKDWCASAKPARKTPHEQAVLDATACMAREVLEAFRTGQAATHPVFFEVFRAELARREGKP